MAKEILSRREINSLIKKIAKTAKKDKMPLSKVFVFGSYAKNKMRKGSDLDLCFISPTFKDTIKAEAYLRTKIYFSSPKINIPFDIVAYRPIDFNETVPLVYEIKKHGKEIRID